jgi:non-heme chloroperoxidase
MASEIKFADLPNQIRVPYIEQGNSSGVPVIFLHGFAGSLHDFQRLLPHLTTSIHAFALTQRGHGDASHPDADYRPQHFAADLVAFLDTLDLRQAVVVGHSMGTAVAMRFAIKTPERVQGLVLVSPRASMQDRPGFLELWETTISKLTDPVDPALVKAFVERTVVRPVPETFLQTTLREAQKVPAHVWKRTFAAALEEDLLAGLEEIQAPTLLVWGAEDASVP